MYTNIDPFKVINALRILIKRVSQKIRKSYLTRMAELMLLNSLFTYENSIYYQTSGLAMGIACTPVIANLFCEGG